MKPKIISWWDKIRVNILGQIPDKPEVKAYLKECADKQARVMIVNHWLERVK